VRPILDKAAKELGIPVYAVAKAPAGDALKIKPIRIGLYDSYGGSMPSGWTKWLFEQYEMPFQVVYPTMLDAGDLKSKFDVIVFVAGTLGGRGGRNGRRCSGGRRRASGGGGGGAGGARAARRRRWWTRRGERARRVSRYGGPGFRRRYGARAEEVCRTRAARWSPSAAAPTTR
jgi:hypothetical protein